VYCFGDHTPVVELISPNEDGVNASPSIKFTSVRYPSIKFVPPLLPIEWAIFVLNAKGAVVPVPTTTPFT
jgi:hypothetical protein